MKAILILLIMSSAQLFAQKTLNPGNVTLESKFIKNETSTAIWYAEMGGQKVEIGKITNRVKKTDNTTLLVETTVKMNKAPDQSWVDSTRVKISDFQPVYHSSYNMMRDMVLKFQKNKVTGYYLDKKTQRRDEISEDTVSPYFDSNTYPLLLRYLPLKEHYSTELSIFDYNPNEKKGVLKAYLEEVTAGELDGKKVWIVKTTDDIQDRKTVVLYYLDRDTREILRQEVNSSGRKMIMEYVK